MPGAGEGRRGALAFIRLTEDPDPSVRLDAIHALALRVRRARPFLERLTSDSASVDGFWTVGEEAAIAIVVIDTGMWAALPGEPTTVCQPPPA